jgi:hypothetical protein
MSMDWIGSLPLVAAMQPPMFWNDHCVALYAPRCVSDHVTVLSVVVPPTVVDHVGADVPEVPPVVTVWRLPFESITNCPVV